MKIKLLLFFLFFYCLQFSFADENDSLKDNSSNTFNYSKAPTIGYNIGVFNFFGDVKLVGYKPPFYSLLGHQLYISQPLSNSFAITFSFVAGKIFGEETRGTENLNFRSSLFAQSLMLEYNFHHLINPNPEKKISILPFAGVGIEALAFHSKSDIQNVEGKKYYYWDDGSIKDLPQLPQNVDNAVTIERDYTYETELRDANLDGFGKYSQLTFSLPFTIGADLKVGKSFGFRLGTAFHYTFSDMLDNLSSLGSVNRQGKTGNDLFLFTSLGINYKFSAPKVKTPKPLDTDEDGIADLFDKCRDTPKGVKVDKQGCPEVNEKDRDGDGVMDVVDRCRDTKTGDKVDSQGCSDEQKSDSDGDGIINAMDKCVNTPAGTKVDEKGCPIAEKVATNAIGKLEMEEKPVEPETKTPEAETKPVEVKGTMESETKPADVTSAPEAESKPVEAKGKLETEKKPLPPKEIPSKFFFADLNKNGKLELDEVNIFIEKMYEGDKDVPIKTVDEILEFYFSQDIE